MSKGLSCFLYLFFISLFSLSLCFVIVIFIISYLYLFSYILVFFYTFSLFPPLFSSFAFHFIITIRLGYGCRYVFLKSTLSFSITFPCLFSSLFLFSSLISVIGTLCRVFLILFMPFSLFSHLFSSLSLSHLPCHYSQLLNDADFFFPPFSSFPQLILPDSLPFTFIYCHCPHFSHINARLHSFRPCS